QETQLAGPLRPLAKDAGDSVEEAVAPRIAKSSSPVGRDLQCLKWVGKHGEPAKRADQGHKRDRQQRPDERPEPDTERWTHAVSLRRGAMHGGSLSERMTGALVTS